MWCEPDIFRPHFSLSISDPELKIIRDLGVSIRTRAMIEGIVSEMKALEVVVVVNNLSTEGAMRFDALCKRKKKWLLG